MTTWLLHPRDPLIFRDGRPFTAVPGERATSLPFPFPATLAGAARTMFAESNNFAKNEKGRFSAHHIEDLRRQSIRGPFLVELDSNGAIMQWLFPAPADALLVERKQGQNETIPVWCYPLSPFQISAGVLTDLGDGLSLVGTKDQVKDKAFSHAPGFWNWGAYQEWLLAPRKSDVNVNDLGIRGLTAESRSHVSIVHETQTALPGALFQTSGLEFALPSNGDVEGKPPNLSDLRHFALVVETDETLPGGLGFLGGERRTVTWRKITDPLPACPPEVKAGILATGSCRLILATPAYFKEGFLPVNLKNLGGGIQIHAAALPRYQTISGWDYDLGRPKPTCRLVPAGSTYFIEFEDKGNELEKLIDHLWLHPINDDQQFDRDGFGLPVLGVWDAKEVRI